MSYSETHFVKQYEPGSQARVELRNGRIVDVINGRYYDAGTSITLHGGKIESIGSGPNLAGEPADVTPDYSIDLQGKTVLPGLYNTHIHFSGAGTTRVPGLGDILRPKRHNEEQIVKSLADCLTHGVTTVRDAGLVADLRVHQTLKERILTGELPGPRILQAVVVGPDGFLYAGEATRIHEACGYSTGRALKRLCRRCGIPHRRDGRTSQGCR